MNFRARTIRRAFTLLELLVVISIIAILVALLIGAGVAITRNAKVGQTKGVLGALDRALDEYIMANSSNIPPFDQSQYARTPGPDGPNGADPPNPSAYLSNGYMPQRPDASVFLRQAKGVGDADSIIAEIPEQFLILTVLPQSLADSDPILQANDRDASPSVVDAWANDDWPGIAEIGSNGDINKAWPIREQSLVYYIHPGNRRNRTDTSLDDHPDAQELYGETVNGRPYFLSAGPDRLYGHPDEFAKIVAFYSMKQRQGESDFDYQNRALLQARKDNLYSSPVDINFTISPGVLNAFIQ